MSHCMMQYLQGNGWYAALFASSGIKEWYAKRYKHHFLVWSKQDAQTFMLIRAYSILEWPTQVKLNFQMSFLCIPMIQHQLIKYDVPSKTRVPVLWQWTGKSNTLFFSSVEAEIDNIPFRSPCFFRNRECPAPSEMEGFQPTGFWSFLEKMAGDLQHHW